jgi:hypothetical protein
VSYCGRFKRKLTFGPGLLSVGFDRYGSEEELVRDPIKHLFDVSLQQFKEGKANRF